MVLASNFTQVSKPRIVFLKTTIGKDGEVLAIMGDRQVLGDQGLMDYKKALAAGQAPLARKGIFVLSAAQIQDRLIDLIEQEDKKNVA